MDLLFGLDMLKAHQACIDLEKNVLRIQGREVRFLAEHELPDKARIFETASTDVGPASLGSQMSGAQQSFPGAGNTLGAPPAPVGAGRGGAQVSGSAPRFSEEAIRTLMSLGATRELAISSLEAAGGNLDIAASLLF